MSDDIGLATLEKISGTSEVSAITTQACAGFIPTDSKPPGYVIDVVSNNSVEHIAGSAGLSQARVRVDSYEKSRAKANVLAETIRTKAMKSTTRGSIGTTHAIQIREINLEAGPFWMRRVPKDGSDDWITFTRCDYMIYYVQTKP
jgi:hypothetical protein